MIAISEIDAKCLRDFPELQDYYQQEKLLAAGDAGLYIFFEDYFNAFVQLHGKSEYFFQRVGAFVEEFAASPHAEVINLTQIGILEGLVNRNVIGLAPFIGPRSRKLLLDASHRTKVDVDIWLKPK